MSSRFEPVGWALLEKNFSNLTFSHETGDKPSQDDIEWARGRGHEYVELFTAAQMRQAERHALERAEEAMRKQLRPEAARAIRALIEQSSVASKEGTK